MAEDDLIWGNAPIPVVVIDTDNKIVEANPAMELMLNRSARRLNGCSIYDFLTFPDKVADEKNTPFSRIHEDHTPIFIRGVDVKPKDAPVFSCALRIARVARAKEVLLVLFFDWHAISNPLEEMIQQAHSVRTSMGMSQMLMHEIRNPLAGIAGAAQLLEMTKGDDRKNLTNLILEETQRIVRLLGQVENFGDLRPPERTAINIHTALDTAQQSAAVGFARHMAFQMDYDPSLPDTFGDAEQLVQVFLNLLKNGAEANPKGGGLRIKTSFNHKLRVQGNKKTAVNAPLLVEIADNGPGLPDEIADHIFNPFVSGKNNGTGLGLAVVAKIITAHEGRISVQRDNGWTRFLVSLPVVRE